MKPAEFIELLELSNDKLAQYKTAAAADASKADKAGDFKKGNKRFSGIVKATNKQFANDAKSGVSKGILAELDMFAPRTVYFKMADGNYIKADYRGSEGLTGHKANDNVTFTGMSWVPVNTARSLGLDKFLAKGSDPSTTVSQNAQNIVGTSSAGEGPLGNRTIDVVDFVNGKEDAVPSALKTKVMQWVQKNTPQQQQGVAEGSLEEDKGMTGYNAFKREWRAKHGADAKVPAYDSKEYTSYVYRQNDKKQGVAEGKEDKIAQLKKDHETAVHWSKNEKSPQKREAARQKAEKIKAHLEKQYKQGVAEGRENFNGINLLLQKDDEEVFVKASAGSRELGHVLFVMDGDYLMPQDLEVEEKYRGQGIAQTMYDFVKSKGYKIRRSGQQTDAGAGFWAKHRPEQNVWEEQHSESCPHCGGEMVSEELMNEKKDACYYKVKSRYKVWPSAYASGALVKCRKKGADSWGNGGKKNESSILEGINQTDESLHDWFNKEKWVRMDTKGNIKGPCAKEPGEGKPKCLPQAKAHSLGKKGRASAAARKRREDPNPDRSGKAINVNTKKEK